MTETLWNRKRELCEEILETLKVTKFYNWLSYYRAMRGEDRLHNIVMKVALVVSVPRASSCQAPYIYTIYII